MTIFYLIVFALAHVKSTIILENLLAKPNPWTRSVQNDPVSASSSAIIQSLVNAGGWGMGDTLRIDFSFTFFVNENSSTPYVAFQPTSDWYYPDCDKSTIPLTYGGALEDESNYQCKSDGDCHLLVADKRQNLLFEVWRASLSNDGTTINGGCMAIWNMSTVYDDTLRGLDCTSADTAGFPISPLLFSADEVATGSINHAIRFILPNNRIRHSVYVAPSTHSTSATSGNSNSPPYGVRLRLKSSFDLSRLPSNGARVLAKALQVYGMMLADGGNMALTGLNDEFTSEKWMDLQIDTNSLSVLKPTDFEVVDFGAPITYGSNCNRNSITRTFQDTLTAINITGYGNSTTVKQAKSNGSTSSYDHQLKPTGILIQIVISMIVVAHSSF